MRSRFLRSARGPLAVLALLLTAPVWATTLLYADLPQLTHKSESIVRGTVTSVEARWSADRSRIVTEVQVQVAERLKGSPPETVILIHPGGVVGDIGQHVAGVPEFQAGEDVVLFLESHGGAAFRVSGFSQGKYRLARNEDGVLMAHPGFLGSARVLDPVTREEVQVSPQPMPFDQLKLKVFSALSAGPGKPSMSTPEQPKAPVRGDSR